MADQSFREPPAMVTAMFRHELSTFLLQVLDAVAARTEGVSVGPDGEADARDIHSVAREVGSDAEDVRWALIGLHAGHCLMETCVELPGIEPLLRWTVHPQCTDTVAQGSPATDFAVP